MQLSRFPSEAELTEAYAEASSEDYVEEEAGQRATARETLRWVEAHAGARGRMLDLGCWVGFLLDEARSAGWDPVGIEPSQFASDFARQRLGLDVRTDDLFTCPLPEASFDAVVLGDVIEHLPDPGGALERIAALSRPGGLLHLALPDAGSRLARILGRRWWSVIPTHVQYFTRGSLATLLARQGWTVLAIRTAPKAFTVRYYLSRLGGYSPGLGRAVVGAAERAGVADRIWAPDFRDRMAVLARAPA
jgi:SAM-dependent methyltransferase